MCVCQVVQSSKIGGFPFGFPLRQPERGPQKQQSGVKIGWPGHVEQLQLRNLEMAEEDK